MVNLLKLKTDMQMDLQTRKLNLISYLAQIQDEKVIRQLENQILNQAQGDSYSMEPFTIQELLKRIEKSEDDFKSGKFKTQDELEKVSASW